MRFKYSLALTAVIVGCLVSPRGGAQSEDLFVMVPQDQIAAMPNQQRVLMSRLRAEKSTKSLTVVTLNLDLLNRPHFDLSLRPDLRLRATAQKTDGRTREGYTWLGTLPGTPGVVILVVRGQNVTGTIRSGKSLFRLSPLGAGFHALVELDESKFPPEGPPLQRGAPSGASAPAPPRLAASGPKTAAASPVVEVLVAYTASAAAQTGDIQGLIQLAIAEANQSYQNSGINLQLHLAYTHQVDFDESKSEYYDESKKKYDIVGHYETIVKRFRDCDDVMDEVHGLRDTYTADIAVLIVNRSGLCGKAAAELAEEDSAFAVVHYDCAIGHYSFAHEIGHLQGADHDPQWDPITPFAYGHGYSHGSDWRTIMSVEPSAPTRLPYWSGPNLLYGGSPMGTAATHDNARVLNETAARMAALRPLQPAIPFTVRKFSPWAGYGIPNGVWMLGDVSGDGKSDVIHAAKSDGGVNTWLSNGDGTFKVVKYTPWGGYGVPNGIWLTGDINGDGRSDIAHAVLGTGGVNTWLSQGDGTYNVVKYTAWAGYGIPNGVWMSGDVDGNGKSDLIHAVLSDGAVNTWLSKGDGTYNVVKYMAWPGYGVPNGVWQTGDINGDGRTDLIHAVRSAGAVNTWLSKGDGTFHVVTFKPWGGYGVPNGVWLTGDVNGDGRTDIAHAVQSDGGVNTWLSNGDGTYNVVKYTAWGGYGIPNGVWMAGDVNGDTKSDLLHAVETDGSLNAWLSQGNGTYKVVKLKPWSCYGIPRGVWLTGDISGEGKPDVVHAVEKTDYVHPWIFK